MKRFFAVIGLFAVLYAVCGSESAGGDKPAAYHITLPKWDTVKSCITEIQDAVSALTSDLRIETVPASESEQTEGTRFVITIAG